MAKNVTDFKQILTHGGARPNLFEIEINFPDIAAANVVDAFRRLQTPGVNTSNASFLVKSGNIPASNISSIPVDYRGRVLPVPGDRTFDPWTVTVYNDGDFILRSAFETWSRGINALTENVSQLVYKSPLLYPNGNSTATATVTSYYANLIVRQLARDGVTPNRNPQNHVSTDPGAGGTTPNGYNIIRAYQFYDAWCSNVSSIDLDYGNNNAIEEFTVQFEYSYYEAIDIGQLNSDFKLL